MLFVREREGHFCIILKKGRGSSPQSPPSARACSPSLSYCANWDQFYRNFSKNEPEISDQHDF